MKLYLKFDINTVCKKVLQQQLEEMDLTTFSLKKYPNLYLAGEVLNIDAITGGFNFQAAWTGGWLVSQAV